MGHAGKLAEAVKARRTQLKGFPVLAGVGDGAGQYPPQARRPARNGGLVEFAGIGPAPMASMLLADMGATVIRIDRVTQADLGVPMADEHEFTKRSRSIIKLDLKRPDAIEALR